MSGVLFPLVLSAQDIIIPEEFLSDETRPLDLDLDLGGGEAADSEDEEAGERSAGGDLSVADEVSAEVGGATSVGLARPSVAFTGDYFEYVRKTPGSGDRHIVRGDLKVKFEGRFGGDLAYTVTPQLRQDGADNGINSFEFRERDRRRPAATFHEASLDWLGERFQVSVGKKIFNWGVADAYNPIDNLNPRDFLDVPTNERIGVPAISLYHLNDHFEVQAVWEPWFTPSRLPLRNQNRWRGDFRDQQRRAAAALGFPVQFAFAGRDLPSDQLANGEIGVRLSSSTLLDGWDLALTYLRGRHAEGVFVGALTGTTLFVSLEYPRYHEFGASFSTVVGPWELHGEGAWHLTDNEQLDDDYLEYVLGVNRVFGGRPLPGVEEVRLILEFAGQAVTRSLPNGSPSFGSRQFSRPFEDALAGSVVLKFSEETELECSGAFDFADEGSIFQAALSHELNEHVEVTLGTDLLSGSRASFFGKWDDNDRIFLTVDLRY